MQTIHHPSTASIAVRDRMANNVFTFLQTTVIDSLHPPSRVKPAQPANQPSYPRALQLGLDVPCHRVSSIICIQYLVSRRTYPTVHAQYYTHNPKQSNPVHPQYRRRRELNLEPQLRPVRDAENPPHRQSLRQPRRAMRSHPTPTVDYDAVSTASR